jgi:hypothetical protein
MRGRLLAAVSTSLYLLLLTFMISVSVPSLALSADVAVRRRHEEHVNFVMRELSHRSKNLSLVWLESFSCEIRIEFARAPGMYGLSTDVVRLTGEYEQRQQRSVA